MATHGYHVEIGALRATAERLRSDGGYLSAEQGRVPAAAVPGQAFARTTGSAPAAQAWRAALAALERRLAAVAAKLGTESASLTAVAAGYEQADQHVATLFQQLHVGSRGPAVEQLQRFLRDAGYDPQGIDGRYGPATARAAAAFTRAHPYPPVPAR